MQSLGISQLSIPKSVFMFMSRRVWKLKLSVPLSFKIIWATVYGFILPVVQLNYYFNSVKFTERFELRFVAIFSDKIFFRCFELHTHWHQSLQAMQAKLAGERIERKYDRGWMLIRIHTTKDNFFHFYYFTSLKLKLFI